jgi:hypothetical protein
MPQVDNIADLDQKIEEAIIKIVEKIHGAYPPRNASNLNDCNRIDAKIKELKEDLDELRKEAKETWV